MPQIFEPFLNRHNRKAADFSRTGNKRNLEASHFDTGPLSPVGGYAAECRGVGNRRDENVARGGREEESLAQCRSEKWILLAARKFHQRAFLTLRYYPPPANDCHHVPHTRTGMDAHECIPPPIRCGPIVAAHIGALGNIPAMHGKVSPNIENVRTVNPHRSAVDSYVNCSSEGRQFRKVLCQPDRDFGFRHSVNRFVPRCIRRSVSYAQLCHAARHLFKNKRQNTERRHRMARQALIKPGHLDKFVVAVHIWSRMKSTRANWIEGRIGSKALKYTGYFGFLEGRIPFPTRSSGAPFSFQIFFPSRGLERLVADISCVGC